MWRFCEALEFGTSDKKSQKNNRKLVTKWSDMSLAFWVLYSPRSRVFFRNVINAKSGKNHHYIFFGWYQLTLWWTNIAIENGPVEIVDFPINSMVIFHGKMLVHQRVPIPGHGCPHLPPLSASPRAAARSAFQSPWSLCCSRGPRSRVPPRAKMRKKKKNTHKKWDDVK